MDVPATFFAEKAHKVYLVQDRRFEFRKIEQRGEGLQTAGLALNRMAIQIHADGAINMPLFGGPVCRKHQPQKSAAERKSNQGNNGGEAPHVLGLLRF